MWAVATGVAAQRQPSLPAPPESAPRLVVFLTIDQFRADYITSYGARWTKGLRRLLDGGAVFTNARYPYALTFTCAGHATIGTGALPYVHGAATNTFYDRATNTTRSCSADADATPVPFAGAEVKEAHGPGPLRAPTFVQLLRAQAENTPQVVSIAAKPRSAINVIGRGGPGTVVVWEDEAAAGWTTSTAYTATPWRDVDQFVRAHPRTDDYGTTWERLLPESAYFHADDMPGEGQPSPWKRAFPHRIESPTGKPDSTFASAWRRSPLSDVFVIDLALHLLAGRKLGTSSSRTDVLAVSLLSLDSNGHEFGPRSHEVQDVLLRVDEQVGRLLDALDRSVGRGRYVVALSSDHGVGDVPEQLTADGATDAGRMSTTELRNNVNAAIATLLGTTALMQTKEKPNYAPTVLEQQLVLAPGLYDKLKAMPGAIDAVKAAIVRTAGVAGAYSADELASSAPTSDPVLRQWRLSYVSDRMADFAIVQRPGWLIRSSSGATHGSPHAYDQHVPLVLYGGQVRAGRIDTAASPADIAPTFAWLTRVRMPQAQGRPLIEGFRR